MGVANHARQTISLRKDLNQAERRCTVLHECLHIERGPVTLWLVEREELRVKRETARLLLSDVRALGEALAWAHDIEEAAFELWVDVGVLRDRLASLHPAERAYLKNRLADQGGP